MTKEQQIKNLLSLLNEVRLEKNRLTNELLEEKEKVENLEKRINSQSQLLNQVRVKANDAQKRLDSVNSDLEMIRRQVIEKDDQIKHLNTQETAKDLKLKQVNKQLIYYQDGLTKLGVANLTEWFSQVSIWKDEVIAKKNPDKVLVNLKTKEKEEKINTLEIRVQNLVELSETQEKINQIHLNSFSVEEQETIKKLIIEYLSYIKFKKRLKNEKLDSDDDFEKLQEHEDCYQKIRDELKGKLERKSMGKVQRILDGYEKLFENEREIENELDKKDSLIDKQKEQISQITNDNEGKKELTKKLSKQERVQQDQKDQLKERRKSLLIANLEGQLKSKTEEIERKHEILKQVATGPKVQNINTVFGNQSINTYQILYQQLVAETEKQITESLTDQEITHQEQQVINKTILFLGTKELFINYRQASINSLIDCYNRLEKSGGKLQKFDIASSMMGITGRLAKIIPSGGVVEAPIGLVGDTINLVGTVIQKKLLEKYTKQFQEILAKDKKNLSLFDGNYLSLINVIWGDNGTNDQEEVVLTIVKTLKLVKTKLSYFSSDHNAFSQNVSRIWQGRSSIKLGEMKSSIKAIINNFNELKQRLQNQKEQLSEQSWFKTIETKTDLLKEQVQAQVEIPPKGLNE